MSIASLSAKLIRKARPAEARSAASAAGKSPSGRALQKGQQTKLAIVDAALSLATQIGLEGLSIGALAEATNMSKSGVFAHFGSREELQISVIHQYFALFERDVFYVAMEQPRGLPRVKALFANWMKLVAEEIQAGCIFISGAVEFDDRPGPVRDALAGMVRAWHAALEKAIRIAIASGDLRPETDATQMLFEIHGLILALHHDARFLRIPGALDRARAGFERALSHYAVPPAKTQAAGKTSPLAARAKAKR